MEKEDKNISLATRIAWMHYIGGHTQASISKQLGFSTTRINRLLALARNRNITQFSISGEISECIALEQKLCQLFNFNFCKVAPNLNEESQIPFKALSIAGADYIENIIHQGDYPLIGVGYGRTLSECINHMSYKSSCDIDFVSLSGGLTPEFSISPYDVIHRIAYRTNAKSYIFPAPMYMPSVKEKKELLKKPEFKFIFNKMINSKLKIVGIGTVNEQASIVQTGTWEKNSLLQAQEQGAEGEILGHFFDKEGLPLNLKLSEKMINPTLKSLEQSPLVAIAGGLEKTSAIAALSRSGYLNGLIIDETTAQAVVDLTA